MIELKKSKFEKFESFATSTHADIAEREATKGDPRFDTPATSGNGVMRIKIYKAIRRKIKDGEIDEVKAIARHYGQSAAGTREENPFEWGLLALYGAAGPIDGGLRGQIRSTAIQLMYAHINNVEPEELLAFLYLSGSVTRLRRELRETNPNLFKKRKLGISKPRFVGPGRLKRKKVRRPDVE